MFMIAGFGCKKDKDNVTVVPVAPTTLTATAASTSQINLSWTDNSTNETGFKVQRKTGTGAYADIATVNKDVTAYADKGLTPSTTYTYRVYAYNTGGNSLTYTNEATAKTLDDIQGLLKNGLVAYYPFTGNAGDSSGNNNHGTVNGATLTTDRFGNANKAYSFDGVNNFIQAVVQNLPLNNSARSFSAYIYTSLLQDAFGTIVSYGEGVGVANAGKLNDVFVGTTTNRVYLANNEIGTYTDLTNSIVNSWKHIVITYDGVNLSNIKIYVDGQLQISTRFNSFNLTQLITTNSNLFIGKTSQTYAPNGQSTNYRFKGKLDDIRIYNRVLTQDEITYLANN